MSKRLGICVRSIYGEDSHERVRKFLKRAQEDDWKVLLMPIGMSFTSLKNQNDVSMLPFIKDGPMDALIIDCGPDTSPAFLNSSVKKALDCDIPVAVMGGVSEGAFCLNADRNEHMAGMIRHLTGEMQRKKIAFIGGGILFGAIHRPMENRIRIDKANMFRRQMESYTGKCEDDLVLESYDRAEVLRNFLIHCIEKRGEDSLPQHEYRAEAVLCGDDNTAIAVCEILEEMHVRVPEDMPVACLGERSILSHTNWEVITNNEDLDNNIDRIFSYLNGKIKEIPAQAEVMRYSLNNGLEGESVATLAETLRNMDQIFSSNEQFAFQRIAFANEFIHANGVSEMTGVMEKYLAEDTWICVRECFLNADSDRKTSDAPTEDEECIILADRRVDSQTWKKMTFREAVGMLDPLTTNRQMIISLPILFQNNYFGFILQEADGLGMHSRSLEPYSLNLNQMMGRFIAEHELQAVHGVLTNVEEDVRRMRNSDMLTGMLNTLGFNEEMEKLLEETQHTGERLAMICVDVDRLGNINEIYGHSEGDLALQTIAGIIKDSVGERDVCARLGNDEFVVVSRFPQGQEGAVKAFIRVLDGRMDTYNCISGKEYTIDLNFSHIVIEPAKQRPIREYLSDAFAKKRLTKETRRRRNGTENEEKVDEREQNKILGIIRGNRFRYAYQPIVSAKDGEIVAYEALLRCVDDIKISPLTVLKYAEMNDVLYQIELATISNVLKDVSEMRSKLKGRKVFLNSIPGHYLTEVDYQKLMNHYGDVMSEIVVEVTEQTDFTDDSIKTLRERSKENGFEVAVDDFGSGYSNLTNLLKYLPDYVKIDHALISGLQEDPKKQHFVKTIIEFAHDNGFKALAEGVETVEELHATIHMGIDLIQGFYTADPEFDLLEKIPEEKVKDILNGNMMNASGAKKKVYIANHEKELMLMPLAIDHYTSILVAEEELKIIGNPDFVAGMTVKIRDNTECTLTLNNVKIGEAGLGPSIDIGENSSLRLVIEGACELHNTGIRVPESASIRLEGSGSLMIDSDAVNAFGIGNSTEHRFGTINCAMDGRLEIRVVGNKAVGIGGGESASGEGINILSGAIELNLASSIAVGIGADKGKVPIRISKANIKADARMGKGTVVGVMHGIQDIIMEDSSFAVNESGSDLCAIGSTGASEGKIRISDCALRVKINGFKVIVLGAETGKLEILINRVSLKITVEGNTAIVIGTLDSASAVVLDKSDLTVGLRVGNPTVLGAERENIRIEGGNREVLVNGEPVAL